MCIHQGCKTQAIYNFEGLSKGIYCSKHKLQGMVDIIKGFIVQNTKNMEW